MSYTPLANTESDNNTYYPLFQKSLTGLESPRVDSGLYYNPSTNTMSTSIFQSLVATGTAPFSVASSTVVPNLNASLHEGYHAKDMMLPLVLGTHGSSTNAFTGNAPDVAALFDGLTIRYWLPYAGTSSSATLNLTLANLSTTGAIAVYYGGSTRLTSHYGAGNLLIMTYRVNANVNGSTYTGWWVQSDYDSNNYDRMYWGANITAGATIYGYKLIMQGTDGKFYPLTLETGTGTTKTVSTQEFRIDSPVLYYASTTDIAANGTLSNVYSEINTTNLNYTANAASFTSQLPIYLKGTILANGNFKLDNTSYTSWLTQTVPTNDDGFVYILLGYMYSTTGIRLFINNPMFQYKDSAFRPYSNASGTAFETTAANIKMDGAQSLGSLSTVPRADHVHPTDTSRASLTSPTFATSIDGGASFSAFASSSALTLGYTGTAASSMNISTGATVSTQTKTINIGTGGAAGSTTTINMGSTAGGTLTINNPSVSLANITASGNISADTFTSTETVTAPFSINSTAVVPNLNASLLGGKALSALWADSDIAFSCTDGHNGYLKFKNKVKIVWGHLAAQTSKYDSSFYSAFGTDTYMVVAGCYSSGTDGYYATSVRCESWDLNSFVWSTWNNTTPAATNYIDYIAIGKDS